MQASAVLQFIPSILMALLLLGGIVLMIVNRPNHGGAAVLGMVGCILLLLGLVSSSVLSFSLPSLMRSLEVSFTALVGVWGLITFIFNASGTGLLIFAVIAKRKPPQNTPPGAPGWQQGPGGQQPWPPNYG